MLTTLLVASLCITLLILAWGWERAREEAREYRELYETQRGLANALAERLGGALREVQRLAGWLAYVRIDAGCHHGDEEHHTHAHALMVEVPYLCDEALDGKPVPDRSPRQFCDAYHMGLCDGETIEGEGRCACAPRTPWVPPSVEWIPAPPVDDERVAGLMDGALQGEERRALLADVAASDEDYSAFADTASLLRALEEQDDD